MLLLRAVLFLLFTSFSTLVAAEADARQWLERLASADTAFAYKGLLIYERGDHTESLRITHGTVDGRPYDHLEHLDGDRREVIRSGSSLTCVYPGQRLTLLLRSHQRSGAGGLDDYYNLQLNGESRVAGRPAVLIEAMPRDSFRLGYRFALDRETGLVLRYEQVDAGQRVLERFQFASLEVSEKMPPEWHVAGAGSDKPVTKGSGSAPLPSAWQPAWLPPGFARVVTSGANDSDDVQTYSDGLAMLSIFVAESKATVDNSGGSAQQGATVARTAQLLRGEQVFVVTVVGEVPLITAQRVADAVAWQGDPS